MHTCTCTCTSRRLAGAARRRGAQGPPSDPRALRGRQAPPDATRYGDAHSFTHTHTPSSGDEHLPRPCWVPCSRPSRMTPTLAPPARKGRRSRECSDANASPCTPSGDPSSIQNIPKTCLRSSYPPSAWRRRVPSRACQSTDSGGRMPRVHSSPADMMGSATVPR